MATTAIWDVKDNLKRVLKYTTNPDKTNNPDFDMFQYKGLENVLEYTTQDYKTEKQAYVSALNCNPETVLSEMTSTKVRYQKIEGILAYHAYQAFAPNEVTAETAHQIGVELAKQMWGERFEVVVSTHIDKKHFHNHFVLNSVSFKDGLRYYDNKANYKKMRLLSDKLCKQYSLSVIEQPKKKSKHYAEWQADKENKPTWRSLIRDDVNQAINQSMTFTQFVNHMKKMGYEVKTNVKHIAVRPAGKDRFIRLRSLSNDDRYDEQHIKERILENTSVRFASVQEEVKPKRCYYKGNLKQARKITGYRALYFKYMYSLGILPKNAPNKKWVHFLLKEDIRYMDQITKETTLLCKKKINTLEDLEAFEHKANECLNKLIKERRCVYNKIRRCKNKDTKGLLQQDITTLSKDIRELRKEVVLYEGIKIRSVSMKEKLNVVKEENEKGKEREKPNERRRNI